jgi:tetratricopeptide (TPR) repeat protein
MRMPVPSQLLSPPANFTGRTHELAALHRITTDDPPKPLTLAVIMGVGGAGKTSLALHWLYQIRERYGGGALFADLGGHLLDDPVRPGDVLGRFLRAFGVAPERVPLELEEQAALWRSLTDRRPLVVLLDNAASAAQVRALLPGPGPSLVVVTSRWRIAGLSIDGARFVELGPLDEAAAVELLEGIVGAERTSAEPDASRSVVRLCGCLPLAVCVSGARLAPNPRRPIGHMADELASERHRLAALSLTDDLSVRTAFDVACRVLPAETARAYRLLALVPGPDFGPGLAAAATATDPGRIAAVLNSLTEASLLDETGGSRFRFHDLVKLHARDQADAEPEADRKAAITRSIDWYLTAAVAADLVVIPGRWRLNPRYEDARHAPPAYTGPNNALAWLESELPGLLAALQTAHDEGLHQQAWQLCEAMWGLFNYRKHFRVWLDVHTIGIASARACAHRRAEARMCDQLGFAFLNLGRHTEAGEKFTRALMLDQKEGHRIGEATALEHLGLTGLAARCADEALHYFIRARAIFEEIGSQRGIALMVRHIGEAHRDSSRYGDAVSSLIEAARLFAALPDRFNEARALTSLGHVYLRAVRPGDAVQPLTEALAIMTGLGSRYEQARIHVLLAGVTEGLGDLREVHGHLDKAFAIYSEIGAPEAGEIRLRLDALGPPAGS